MNVSKSAANLICFSLICLLIFSDFSRSLAQSLVTGYIHNAVCTNWERSIADAKRNGRTSVVLANYGDDCIKTVYAKYGRKVGSFVSSSFEFPPKYIYTRNGDLINLSYAAYYGIDTIYIGNKYVVSWEKSGLPLWDVK